MKSANMVEMRLALRVIAVVALFVGGVFFFQGIGVLPGSFMTGRNEWAIIGAALVVSGLAIFWIRSGR
jgi:hypothetical protein